ncbi:sulfatase family protein [Pelagicoccus mobilis]|uniref:Sulfatase-like hydrolase/transferase n=1 Tax=Pelagicoccus mobilis TaxID=415221 RepID=A0A934S6W5_9BACT|nr:sulfatase-like hydrolase/transferase [Pelagicoccus mobilis]MBK1880038.1 sulfatase-like hydrolase/transferase [Pelagicoccus mobilis]
MPQFLKTSLALLASIFALSSILHSADRPNVIIIFTDDHGWADLSIQGVLEDVKTPHTDQLARSGVLFTSGYVTAPQCRPSRAGLMTGRYQNRFGLEHNGHNGFPWSEYTIAERLRDVGYITGMAGKWHLDGFVDSLGKLPDGSDATPEQINGKGRELAKAHRNSPNPGQVHRHGFQEHFSGSMNNYVATHSANGKKLKGVVAHKDERYRLEVQAEWSVNFIKRHAKGEKPFFLYTSFYAPHVPLEAPEKYLKRFPGKMPERRRKALAMLSAVDDGVGLIRKTLEEEGVLENTIIFYMGDNGAPLKMHKIDAPGGGPGWDGSLNEPWIGEKGMLTEGGIRVPFIASWPAGFPGGQVDDRPVISIDTIATALVAGGAKLDDRIDGVDLSPYLTGKKLSHPHENLYWRWAGQYAIRSGKWKYLKAGKREYLFDLSTDAQESKNLIQANPEIAATLKGDLISWSEEQYEPGFDHPVGYAGNRYFDHYLDGKRQAPPQTPAAAKPAKPTKQRSLFKLRDTNKDGFVTLAEFIGDPEGRNVSALTKRFHNLDKNGDAQLDSGELK